METIVVIGIIAIAGVYVARLFYLKFSQGKSNNGNPCCSGCSCKSACSPEHVNDK